MLRERLPLELTRKVKPAALRQYVSDLGWPQVPSRRADAIAIYQTPGEPVFQVIVPIDEGLADYAEAVSETINRLAQHQHRSARELLDQLVLPPADLFQLELANGPSAGVALPLNYAIDMLSGARKALLATAHAVLDPRPVYSRLDHQLANCLTDACQISRAHQPTLAVVLTCPLDAVPTEECLLEGQPPFTRRVTGGLMRTLKMLADAVAQQHGDQLLRPGTAPLLSANLCEALSLLCPPDRQQALTISAVWSRQVRSNADVLPERVVLPGGVFALAEYLAPRLRTSVRPQPTWHVGFVEGLQGRPGSEERLAGEVQVAITQADEVLHARLELDADEYALASTAHLNNTPVYFRGVLYRSVSLHRVEQVGPFLLVQRPPLAQAS